MVEHEEMYCPIKMIVEKIYPSKLLIRKGNEEKKGIYIHEPLRDDEARYYPSKIAGLRMPHEEIGGDIFVSIDHYSATAKVYIHKFKKDLYGNKYLILDEIIVNPDSVKFVDLIAEKSEIKKCRTSTSIKNYGKFKVGDRHPMGTIKSIQYGKEVKWDKIPSEYKKDEHKYVSWDRVE